MLITQFYLISLIFLNEGGGKLYLEMSWFKKDCLLAMRINYRIPILLNPDVY